jgi:sodium/pantothenate symporter
MILEISTGQRIAIIATFAIYTVILLFIAYMAKRVMDKTAVDRYVEEFYTGGRGMGALMVCFMIAAGLCGAGTFVGSPGLAYRVGGAWLLINGCQIFVTFVVLGEIGKKVGIVARRINAQSYLELIAHRYCNNKAVILLGAVAITVFMTSFVVAQSVGGARIFESMTGLPYIFGLVLFGVTVVLITTLGGIRGVAIAVVVQGLSMTVAVIVLLIASHGEVANQFGGWEEMSRAITQREPQYFNPYTWSIPYQFSQYLIYGFTAIAMPHLAMSALTYKNGGAMKRAIMLGVVVVTFWTIGLGIYAALAAKGMYPDLTIPDQAVPVLTMKVLPTWLAGVTLAGVASAVQSTVSGVIIVISSTLVLNCYKLLYKPKATAIELKKATMVTTGIIACAIFALAVSPPDLLQLLITFGIGGMAAAFFSTLLVGIYWPRANEQGALACILGGFVVYAVANAKVLPFDISLGMHPVGIAMLVALVLLVTVSLATPKPPKGVIMTWFGKDYPTSVPDK